MPLKLPLDNADTTNIIGAYALFRLSSTYTGATVNIRNSSTGLTKDFYANVYGEFGDALNGTGNSLDSWLGTATGYITTWYDQSGRGKHATQSTTGNQPTIDIYNRFVDFTANSGQSYFILPDGTVPQNFGYTVTMKHGTMAATGCWLSAGNYSTGTSNNFRADTTRYLNYWFGNDFWGDTNTFKSGNIVTYMYDLSNNYNSVFINGAACGVSAPRSGWAGVSANDRIGCAMNNASPRVPGEYFNGQMYYLYIFNVPITSKDRGAIEINLPIANQNVRPISFSQLRSTMGLIVGSSSSISLSSTLSSYAGISSNTSISVSNFSGFKLRNGLFMRYYNASTTLPIPSTFTPIKTGVTTNLSNFFTVTGGFANAGTGGNTEKNIIVGNTSNNGFAYVPFNTNTSVELFGYFYAPVDGNYIFYIQADDYANFWIGSTALSGFTSANANGTGGYVSGYSIGYPKRPYTVNLTKGTYYPLRIQFSDVVGEGYYSFGFNPPNGATNNINYDGTGYYFCYSLTDSNGKPIYYMLDGYGSIKTTTIQGTDSSNPATSGFALMCNPWLENGFYYIQTYIASAPTNIMFVDIGNGGFDYFLIGGTLSTTAMDGTSVTFGSSTAGTGARANGDAHSGTNFKLELLAPRSMLHWTSIYNFVTKTLSSTFATWVTGNKAIAVYSATADTNWTSYAMFDPRLGNTTSYILGNLASYNGVSTWRVKDGGLWLLRDISYGEPNGDYLANTFLGCHNANSRLFGAPGFNDQKSDSVGYYTTGTNYIVSTNFAGITDTALYIYLDGSTYQKAAPSATYIKNYTGTNINGVYWINLPTVGPTQIYCIMDYNINGGGWMMAMKATRGLTFTYPSTHWTTVTTLSPDQTNRNDGDAKFHTMNYFAAKDLLALWPDIPSNTGVAGNNGGSLSTAGCWSWLQNNFYTGGTTYNNKGANIVRITLISLFSTVTRYFIGDAKLYSGWGNGVFSSQTDVRFYGFNYYNDQQSSKFRWGFGWNENGGGLFPNGNMGSDDVTGGIGLNGNQFNTSTAAYSAGDFIGCCQDTTGINRSARVEIYIR